MAESSQIARAADLMRALRLGRRLARHDGLTPAQLVYERDRRMRRIVLHAHQHSPFYRRHWAGVDPATAPLDAFAVVERRHLVQDLGGIVTDPRLDAMTIATHARDLEGDDLLHGCYRVMATGGTTGSPVLVVYDRASWVELLSYIPRASALMGFGPAVPRLRLAMVLAGGPLHMSRRIATASATAAFKRLALRAADPLDTLVAQLQDHRPDVLSGYPSALALLASEQLEGRLDIRPRVVFSSSEQLTREMRSRIRSAFGVEPFDTYSTTETGLVAAECEAHAGMHVFEDLCRIEVVDENHQPVPDGHVGDHVLVTNLHNRAMPIIRYAVGDAMAITRTPCACGRPYPRITAIEGRREDALTLTREDGAEVKVHPNVFLEVLDGLGLRDYEVVQRGAVVHVTVVPGSGPRGEALSSGLVDRLGRELGRLGLPPEVVRPRVVETLERQTTAVGKYRPVRVE